MDDEGQRSLNKSSLLHRHHSIQKKLWKFLGRLEEASAQRQVHARVIKKLSASYDEFYVYTLYTVKIVLEDALFVYRRRLSDSSFRCVGDMGSNTIEHIDHELLQQALILMVGSTPVCQRRARFKALGYGWFYLKFMASYDVLKYRRLFLSPLLEVKTTAHHKMT